LDEKSLESLGHWLRRRWYHCQAKKMAAQAETKPAPRMFSLTLLSYITHWLMAQGRSKNKGRQAVEAILALDSAMGSQKQAIMKMEKALATGDLSDVTDLSEKLQDARDHYSCLEQGLHRKRAQLGINEVESLTQLRSDAFLRLRMNALALKQRIRDRLRYRKFEIEKLERSYRRSTNGMCLLSNVHLSSWF
jgi:hypothetical protein